MGLDIGYATVRDYLADRFESPALASRAIDVIRQEIERQTKRKVELSENKPTEQLINERYGPYSALHVLRLYASRLAGYTLDEAYGIPVKRISFRKTRLANDEDDREDATWADEASEEQEFSDQWGVPLDELVPLAPRKQKPFPFKNLVCFSDTEGIYLPISFPEPFRLDDLYVGSSIHLNIELKAVGKVLVEGILSTMKHPHKQREQFLLYVRQLWWALAAPCEKSVKSQTSMFFG